MQNFRAERQIEDTLKLKNEHKPMVSIIYNLLLNFNVFVWREGNVEHSGKITESYKLIAIENKTCILQLPSGLTNFRITIIKSYL